MNININVYTSKLIGLYAVAHYDLKQIYLRTTNGDKIAMDYKEIIAIDHTCSDTEDIDKFEEYIRENHLLEPIQKFHLFAVNAYIRAKDEMNACYRIIENLEKRLENNENMHDEDYQKQEQLHKEQLARLNKIIDKLL